MKHYGISTFAMYNNVFLCKRAPDAQHNYTHISTYVDKQAFGTNFVNPHWVMIVWPCTWPWPAVTTSLSVILCVPHTHTHTHSTHATPCSDAILFVLTETLWTVGGAEMDTKLNACGEKTHTHKYAHLFSLSLTHTPTHTHTLTHILWPDSFHAGMAGLTSCQRVEWYSGGRERKSEKVVSPPQLNVLKSVHCQPEHSMESY